MGIIISGENLRHGIRAHKNGIERSRFEVVYVRKHRFDCFLDIDI